MNSKRERSRRFKLAGAVVLLAAACFATLGAWISYVTLCETGCQPPPRHLTAQLVIAVLGLSAAVAMTIFVARGRQRTAAALLLAAVILYAAWGVVLDQATHGSYFWQ